MSSLFLDVYGYTAVSMQSHLFQGRTSGRAFFLLACIHPVTSSKGWLNFSSIYVIGQLWQAAPCMQARKMHAHLFYLGIDDFGFNVTSIYLVENKSCPVD